MPRKRWLEARIAESPKTVLFVSHDRELFARTAERVVTMEAGTAWTHPGGFASWPAARTAHHSRLDEQRRRWDEERTKPERLVTYYKVKAAHDDGMASRLQATRRDWPGSTTRARRRSGRASSRSGCSCAARGPAGGRWRGRGGDPATTRLAQPPSARAARARSAQPALGPRSPPARCTGQRGLRELPGAA